MLRITLNDNTNIKIGIAMETIFAIEKRIYLPIYTYMYPGNLVYPTRKPDIQHSPLVEKY